MDKATATMCNSQYGVITDVGQLPAPALGGDHGFRATYLLRHPPGRPCNGGGRRPGQCPAAAMIVVDGLEGLEFHHIGVACRDLDREAAAFAGLGYGQEGEDFEDPLQGIKGRFLTGAGPRIELVMPASDVPGVLTNLLAQGHKMYHLAFTTNDLKLSLEQAAAQRAKLVVEPVPAIAFGGRKIAFLFLRNMLLLELIER